jgi:hypothetical protein
MKKFNESWHRNNPMPPDASIEESIEWHLKHFRFCGCRDIPFKLKKEMQKRNIKIPKPDRR